MSRDTPRYLVSYRSQRFTCEVGNHHPAQELEPRDGEDHVVPINEFFDDWWAKMQKQWVRFQNREIEDGELVTRIYSVQTL